MGSASKAYLLAYNVAQALGWLVALFKLANSVLAWKSTAVAYSAAGELIYLLQLSAMLEVFHSALGLVPGKLLPALLQWGGRFHFVTAIVRQIPEVHKYRSVFVTFLAWCLSEVIRYPHYALNLSGLCPKWLAWLRYSAFIILYPIGALPGEMLTMYRALPIIEKKQLYSSLFGKLHFTYYSFIVVLLVCYPFIWMKLYLYMINQRKAKLYRGIAQKRRTE